MPSPAMRLLPACSVLALALALAACTQPQVNVRGTPAAAQVQAESARLNAWFDAKYEEQLQFSPLGMTALGRKDRYGELDDMSPEAMERQAAWARDSVRTMEAEFNHDLLDEQTRISWALWKLQAEQGNEALRWRAHSYPLNQMFGAHTMLPTMLINFHRVDSEQDFLDYVSRLRAVPRAFEQIMGHVQASAAQGILPPRFALDVVADQSRRIITGAPFGGDNDSALWADLQAKADKLVENEVVSAERGTELKQQARAALLEGIGPSYESLIGWAQANAPRASVNPKGVGSTHPDGMAYYNFMLRRNTTTDMDAESVHQLGVSEVARLRGEMEALKQQVGFEGDLPAFFKFIATDPQFKYPNTDAGRQAYIDDATRVIDNIRGHLPEYFGLLPKAELVVRRVESFREQDGAPQHYNPPALDGSRPGVYYAHLSSMDAMPKPELEVIAYHEGLPGHHMQIAIAQELTGLPRFRTLYGVTAYSEGWGLYSEWLAKEMPGTYQDPYSEYGRLTSEMWRAIRLVVDTGMHAKGWTEEQAVAYFRANSSIPEAAVRAEVQRYLVMPGQATAYKIGMIRIQQLRAKAERELGDRFDIRGFHDTILGGGAMPLDLLERRVDAWIAQRKAG